MIAATNQDLQELIAQGKFRKDLYYRLNIISMEIPPLRQRKGDIPLLAVDFIVKHSKRISRKVEGISPDALELLMDYEWPGNIRELENVIERAIILTKSTMIMPEDLPEFLTEAKEAESSQKDSYKLKDALKEPEKDLILKALEAVDWNRNDAAKALGINRTTLYKKMVKYGLLNNHKVTF